MADLATYVADVKKYASGADEAAIAGLVKYLGIALRNRDSALVTGTDPKEVARVRDNFLKQNLGLTDTDDKLDASIQSVLDKLRADRTKSRVTVYYLLAEQHRKLEMFTKPGAKPATKAASGPRSPSKSTSAKSAKPAAKAASKPAAKPATAMASAAKSSPAKAPAKATAKAAKPAAKKPALKAAAKPAAKAASKPAAKASKPAAKASKPAAKSAAKKK